MKKHYNFSKVKMKNPFRKKQVFISYSRKDEDLIQSFFNNEKNRGFTAFMDEADKEVGSDWQKRIKQKIDKSDAFLFISKNSLRSDSPIRQLEIQNL